MVKAPSCNGGMGPVSVSVSVREARIFKLLFDHFDCFVALTADEDSVLRIAYADSLKVIVFHSAVIVINDKVRGAPCIVRNQQELIENKTGGLDHKTGGFQFIDLFLSESYSDGAVCNGESFRMCIVIWGFIIID